MQSVFRSDKSAVDWVAGFSLLVPSGIKHYLTLDDRRFGKGEEVGPLGCPETSVTTDQHRINVPEEPKPHLHSGGRLKSRADVFVHTSELCATR